MTSNFLTYFRVVIVIEGLVLLPCVSPAADRPIPSEKSCKLDPIQRPPVEATVQLLPGISAEVVLDRRATLKKKRALADAKSKYEIEFDEVGTLAMQADVLNRIMQSAVSSARTHANETCEFSISTFGGTTNWSRPPTFNFHADGKGRKCTSFSYPCGLPQMTCSRDALGIPSCTVDQPMCTQTQKFDLANWSVSLSGSFQISPDSDANTIAINVVSGSPVVDVSGSGEVAQILSNVGLLPILQTIDPNLGFNVPSTAIPSLGRLVAINAPADVPASPILTGATWTPIEDTQSGKFANVGIAYTQVLVVRYDFGCLVAKCLRQSKTEDEYAQCVLGRD
jgi:hypothetical protein